MEFKGYVSLTRDRIERFLEEATVLHDEAARISMEKLVTNGDAAMEETAKALREQARAREEKVVEILDALRNLGRIAPKKAARGKWMGKERTEEKAASKQQRKLEKEEGVPEWSDGQKKVYKGLSKEQKKMALRVSKNMHAVEKRQANAMNLDKAEKEKKGIVRIGKDERVIKMLLHGVKIDKNGKPLNEEEQQHLERDKEIIETYWSDNIETYGSLLDRTLKETFDYPVERLLRDEQKELLDHPAELKAFLSKQVYVENMKRDHPEYFEMLPQETKDRLQVYQNFIAFLSMYLGHMAGSFGVNMNASKMYEESGGIKDHTKMLKDMKELYEDEKAKFLKARGR